MLFCEKSESGCLESHGHNQEDCSNCRHCHWDCTCHLASCSLVRQTLYGILIASLRASLFVPVQSCVLSTCDEIHIEVTPICLLFHFLTVSDDCAIWRISLIEGLCIDRSVTNTQAMSWTTDGANLWNNRLLKISPRKRCKRVQNIPCAFDINATLCAAFCAFVNNNCSRALVSSLLSLWSFEKI